MVTSKKKGAVEKKGESGAGTRSKITHVVTPLQRNVYSGRCSPPLRAAEKTKSQSRTVPGEIFPKFPALFALSSLAYQFLHRGDPTWDLDHIYNVVEERKRGEERLERKLGGKGTKHNFVLFSGNKSP